MEAWLQFRVPDCLIKLLKLLNKHGYIVPCKRLLPEELFKLLDKLSIHLAYLVFNRWFALDSDITKQFFDKSINLILVKVVFLGALLHSVIDQLDPVSSAMLWVHEAIQSLSPCR